MDQQSAPTTLAQPGPAPQTNTPKILKLPKWNRKTFIFILGFALLIVLIPLILLSVSKQNKPAPPPVETPKTWELILNHNILNQTLSLKKLSLLDKNIKQDFRDAQDSPYEVVVIDDTNKALFRNKINITQQLIIEPLPEPISSASAQPLQPLDLETILYIPYQATATKVIVNKDFSPILEINVPPALSLNLVPEAFAQGSSQSCGPMQVVFISDGYTDLNKYQQQVTAIENRIKSTAPYSSYPGMFDFKRIDNQQPLGCSTQGLISCINNTAQIYQVGYGRYASATKFIILVNVTNPLAIDTPGITNDIGGKLAALFTNLPGAPSDLYVKIAAHEFLGHSVGQLYDRYVRSNYPNLLNPNIKSNCTNNSQGEAFWKQAGATSAFKGCGNPNLYAPFPLSCGATQPGFISLGSPQTIMSADGCNSDTFDAVETAWITQNILPKYAACSVAGPVATTAPLPTTAPVPTSSTYTPPVTTHSDSHPTAHFTKPSEGGWKVTYVNVANTMEAEAEAPAGKTLTRLGIYRVPANAYFGSGTTSWTPVGTTNCSGSTCNLTATWTTSAADRGIWQEWYLTVRATDSGGVKCSGNAPSPSYTDQQTGEVFYPCNGGAVAVQILPGQAPEGFQFAGSTSTGSTSTTASPTSNPPNPSTPSSTSGSVYVCEEIPTSGGSQVQIKTLKCSLK